MDKQAGGGERAWWSRIRQLAHKYSLKTELCSFASRALEQVLVEVRNAVMGCGILHVDVGLEFKREPWIVRNDELVAFSSLVDDEPIVPHVRVRSRCKWVVRLASDSVRFFFCSVRILVCILDQVLTSADEGRAPRAQIYIQTGRCGPVRGSAYG